MSDTSWADLTDDDLQVVLKQVRAQAAEYYAKSVECDDKVEALKAEIERRELERFWEAHPGLRVNPGDKLLIAREFIAFVGKSSAYWTDATTAMYRDKIATVLRIGDEADFAIDFEWTPSGTANIPLDVIRSMRQAYLDKYGETA